MVVVVLVQVVKVAVGVVRYITFVDNSTDLLHCFP